MPQPSPTNHVQLGRHALADADAETAKLLAYRDLDTQTLVALALRELAGQLPQIGTLNLTP